MKLPDQDIFHDSCADIVIGFKGQGTYNDRDVALKAFQRRAPDHDSALYATAFDYFCDLYDFAVVTIELFPAEEQDKGEHAKAEDIDYEKCMDHIEQVFPGDGASIKSQILNWVIYWHYLR